MASSAVPWFLDGSPAGLISLGLGLVGVLLARTIFVNKENRALGRRQPWRETLPITGAACLIMIAAIWDQHLLGGKAIGAGLVAGWGTMTIIEGMSRIINPAASAKARAELDPPKPDDAPHLSATSVGRALNQSYPPPIAGHPELNQQLRRIDAEDPPSI